MITFPGYTCIKLCENATDYKCWRALWRVIYNDSHTKIFLIFFSGNKIIVRPEEALIVILVLLLWVGAIGLFFHRWGKIRNCEPYTPKFEENLHRPSCPLTSMDPIITSKRMSLGPLTSIQCGSTWNPNIIGRGKKANKLL